MICCHCRRCSQLTGFHRKGSAIKPFELAVLLRGQVGEHEAGNFSSRFREIHGGVLPCAVGGAISLCLPVRYGRDAGWHFR